MIHFRMDDSTVAVTVEEPDDLLALRRVIDMGDRIISDTTRVIKQEREYSRPDSGKRVRMRLAIEVESATLDHQLDRLRIRGVIVESSNEMISRGSHHSLVVKPNDRLTITKPKWSKVHRSLIRGGTDMGFVLVAVDSNGCGIGRLAGTHLHMLPEIHSGYSGKRYKGSFRIEDFFSEIRGAFITISKKGDTALVFGPGHTKNRLANYLQENGTALNIRTAEGVDSGGQDGLYAFTKSDSVLAAISDSKLAMVSGIIRGVMERASKKSERFTMGFDETRRACSTGAIESLVFSNGALHGTGEDAVIELLNEAEALGAKVYSVDSSTDMGLQVDGLGGMVSLLRFAA